jgi:hypothetical protein
VKRFERVPLPPFVATAIVPVLAPVGTGAVIFESEFTANKADTLLNVTFVACLRPVPVIVTQVPTGPLVGVKVAKVGVTLNCSGAVKVVVPVVTVTFPVSAPAGGEDEGAAGQLSRGGCCATELHHRRRTEALAWNADPGSFLARRHWRHQRNEGRRANVQREEGALCGEEAAALAVRSKAVRSKNLSVGVLHQGAEG